MRYRQIRKKDSGEWLNFLFTEDADPSEPFNIPAAEHVRNVATALGLGVRALEAIDADSDIRTGAMIDLPITSSPQRDNLKWAIEKLVALGLTEEEIDAFRG